MRAALLPRRVFAAATAAALGCAWLAPGPSRARDPQRVQIAAGGLHSLSCLPLVLAEQLGYFAAEGVDVDLVDHSSSARALQAVLAGVADVVCGPYEQTLQMHGRGRAHEAVALLSRTPAISVGVSARVMSDYRTPADLRGRKIGVSAPGSPGDLVAHRLLARAGVPAEDVAFVSVGTMASALAALRAGQVDAISHGEPLMTLLEQRAEVQLVGETRTLRGTRNLFGGPLPWNCLHAPAEFVQRHGLVVQGLVHAQVRALKWLRQAGPRDLIRTVPRAVIGADGAVFLAAMQRLRESLSPDGVLPEDGARTAVRVMSAFESGLGAQRIDWPRTYNNQFALRAKARFQA